MNIQPLHPEIEKYLKGHRLEKKFAKQKRFFEKNPSHPSLHTEILEPREMRIWSFRVDRAYRAMFIFRNSETIEILDINNHYR